MRSTDESKGMSQAALNIGCPHCGSASNVEIARGERGGSKSDGDQLKGKLVRCQYCGDDFSFYYY